MCGASFQFEDAWFRYSQLFFLNQARDFLLNLNISLSKRSKMKLKRFSEKLDQ